jgi:arylsulfatase A-like enzyme
MVISGGLSHPELPIGTGNSILVVPGSGQAARVTLNIASRVTNTPIYYSLLLKITDFSAVPFTAANNFICTLSDTTAAQPQGLSRGGARLVAKRASAGFQLGIGLNSTEFAYATNILNPGDLVFVAACWTYGAAGTNANLWVNPPADSFGAAFPPSPSAGITNGATSGALNANGPRSLLVSCLNATAPGGMLDELRVHTNWAQVTGGNPAILTPPFDQTLAPGISARLTVRARGTLPLGCRWFKNGVTLTDGGNISGASTTNLTLSATSPSDAGSYTVVVTNGLGVSVTSAPAVLKIQPQQGARPNFIVIITDDQRWDSLGVVQREMGASGRFPWFTNGTPNLDRIAREGVRFRNAFVTLPLCSPSRAAIMTGRYNHLNGVINNSTPFPQGAVTYASKLREAGYVTGMVGKWHMGSQVARPGFDYTASFLGQGNYNDTTFYVNGLATPSNGWIDDVSTDHALAFIETNAGNAFALQVGYKSAHGPTTPPGWASNLYSTSVSREVPNLAVPPPFRTNIAANSETAKRNYHRCITAADQGIGRILDRLDQLGIATNTMVIFLGDNGYYLGEHGLGDKRSLYEESLRIPLLVRYPGFVARPALCDELVLNIDIAPTILDLAGVQVPVEMQGRSWRPLLQAGPTPDWRQSFLAEYFLESGYATPTTVAIRTIAAKLTFWPGNPGWTEMFDLAADPYETRNVYSDPLYAGLCDALRAEFDRQMMDAKLAAVLSAPFSGDGRWNFSVAGGIGPKYQIQASEALHEWQPLFDVKMNSTSASLMDSNSILRSRFYRLQWTKD